MAKHHASEPLLQSFGAQVRARREGKGLTREQLGEQLETDAKNVYRLESGTENLTLLRAARIAQALGVALGDLLQPASPPDDWRTALRALGWRPLAAPLDKPIDDPPREALKGVPVLDLQPRAGAPRASVEPRCLGQVRNPKGRKRNEAGLFLAQVCGNSMAPRIPDGAWCLFSQHISATELLGRDVLIAERDASGLQSWVVKRVQSVALEDNAAVVLELRSLNPAYPPRRVGLSEREDTSIVAVVREILQPTAAGSHVAILPEDRPEPSPGIRG